jgi:large subunit ribosomal protein L17
MRHLKSFNQLGRTSSHRKSMMANMASSLILHKRITTTVAKAKALKTYVEPLITKSKKDSTHSRRMVFSYLKDKTAVSELFREISVKVAERPGGYTRILRTGNRLGDNAEMCILELVDYNETMLGTGDTGKAKTGRRRRSKKKATETPVAETKKAAGKPEESEEDVTKEEETKTEATAPEEVTEEKEETKPEEDEKKNSE